MTNKKVKKPIENRDCLDCRGKGSLKGLKMIEGKLRKNIIQECRRCRGTGKVSETRELARPRIKIARTGEPMVYETASEVAERIRNMQKGA